jgi:sugar phosphate isomerase/epimerase
MTEHFEVSYYTATIDWDGPIMQWDAPKVRAKLEVFHRAGIHWMGVDGINLMAKFSCDVDETVALLTAWYKELGLRLSSFHYAGPSWAPLSGGQDAVRANLARNVTLFAQWSPKAFVIHPDWIYGSNGEQGILDGFAAEAAAHGRDRILETIADNLRYMARLAAKHNIRLALETMGHWDALSKPQDLVALVEAIGEPNVGYCLDAGHAHLCGQDVPGWVYRMGRKLFETHFHDNRGVSLAMDEHMPVGFGTIPWVDVIRALRDVDFTGPVTFEATGWPIEDPVEGYRQAMAWWRACESFSKHVGPR